VSDWTGGYVVEVDYTLGYYEELNPLRLSLPFLDAGLLPPATACACELGYGQGVSVAMHAAASDVSWWGTDFNPSQTLFAQAMAEAAGSQARLFDQSFAEFCTRPDLPNFDFIGMHGVWTWVSDENRSILVDFVRRKLKTGGVLYISYNTQPGSAAMVPLRQLLTQHAEAMSAPGRGIAARIDAALEFAGSLFALNPVFLRANPAAAARLQRLKGEARHYLAHEYFNRDWRPQSFSEIAEWLATARLTYACSAFYPDHVDRLQLTAEQQRFLADIPDPNFRQLVRDFVVNQDFRRDYWVKGARRATHAQRAELLRRQRVVLVTGRGDFVPGIGGAALPSGLAAALSPVLDALADHQPRSIGEIEHTLAGALDAGQMRESLMLLIGKGDVAPVQDDAAQAKAKPQTERLNRFVTDRARGSGDLLGLASPVTGGGIGVPRAHQLFLAARARGRTTPQEWAEAAWQTISAQGQRLVKDGTVVTTAEESLAVLVADARNFAETRLPILQALQIA
jgi:SAM-dependent methyltransferase